MTTKKTAKTTKKLSNDDSCYIAPCPSIDTILRVVKLDSSEQAKLLEELKQFVFSIPQSNAISAYTYKLVQRLMVDPDVLKPFKEEEILGMVIREIYECIVDIYPEFSVNKVCAGINQSLAPKPIVTETSLTEKLSNYVESGKGGLGPKTIKDLEVLEATLKKNVIGQDDAIEALINKSKLISVGFEKRGAFFFIGRTGVGKTELAKQFGERFYGKFEKFNCGEYANGHEVSKLLGAPPGYVGSNHKSLLAEKAEQGSRWVFLFDEVEKAHDKLFHVLLSLLDDGKITDSQGLSLDFSNSIFLFTSNQGMTDLKTKSVNFKHVSNSEADKATLRDSLDRLFSPEFRNRIDEFIYFNDLTLADAAKIVRLNLKTYPVLVTDELVDYVVSKCFSTEYGVRELKRFIKSNIALPIANAILKSPVPRHKEDLYQFDVKNGELQVVGLVKDNWHP